MNNLVLLIDDDDASNALNEKLILDTGMASTVVVKNNGKDAINYLSTNPQIPDIILLEVNMPIVDGCVFIHEFENLPEIIKDLSKIYVMTKNTQNDVYLSQLMESNDIAGVIPKPLTETTCVQLT